MHNNMFSDGHERAEVKAALIQHLKRDSRGGHRVESPLNNGKEAQN
jgi:hypothetical protein